MKHIKLFSALFASTLIFGGISLTAYSINTNEETHVASAASHPANYDPYTYTGSYYSSISGTGDALRSKLTSLIHPASLYSYSGSGANTLSSVLQSADEDPNNSRNMIYFYTRDSVTKNAASSWNREHCWPQANSNGCWGKVWCWSRYSSY